jgi:hypothetical protein
MSSYTPVTSPAYVPNPLRRAYGFMYDRGSSYNPLFAPVLGAIRVDAPAPECTPPADGTLDAAAMAEEKAADMRAMMQLLGMSPAAASSVVAGVLAVLNE